MNKTITELKKQTSQKGRLSAICIRKTKREMPDLVDKATVDEKEGIVGDHFKAIVSKKRQVTLIQSEHLLAVATMLKRDALDPRLARRNLVVEGVNILNFFDKKFKIGDVILIGTGYCEPCNRMEENLGDGGYQAMVGHGGITASVVKGGEIKVNDSVGSVD